MSQQLSLLERLAVRLGLLRAAPPRPESQANGLLQSAPPNQLVQDDDSGGGLNARIRHQANADGELRIITTTLNRATGPYLLVVREE
jgi:hypothetical protein